MTNNKKLLLTDMVMVNNVSFRAVYIPTDAYYIYYLFIPGDEKLNPIDREFVRITDNRLTYPPKNVLKYYKDNGKSLGESDKIDMDYTFKEEAESIIQVKLQDMDIKQGGARELVKTIFTEFEEELSFNQSMSDVEPGLIDPLDKPRIK